jgi:hypothetical protein
VTWECTIANHFLAEVSVNDRASGVRPLPPSPFMVAGLDLNQRPLGYERAARKPGRGSSSPNPFPPKSLSCSRTKKCGHSQEMDKQSIVVTRAQKIEDGVSA